jgi:hypothetical protein
VSDFFEYKFRATGGWSPASPHCTYCPKQTGEACLLTCSAIYEKLKTERETDGVIVVDEPAG